MDSIETKKNIIAAGRLAIEELVKVAKEKIVDSEEPPEINFSSFVSKTLILKTFQA